MSIIMLLMGIALLIWRKDIEKWLTKFNVQKPVVVEVSNEENGSEE